MMRFAVTGPIPLTFWSSKADALLMLIFAALGAIFVAGLETGEAVVLGVFAMTVIPFEAEAAIPARTGATNNRPRPLAKARTLFGVNIVWILDGRKLYDTRVI